MLKKSMAAVVMVMVFALALAGCGGSDGVMSKGMGIFSATKQLLIRRLLK